MSVPQSKPVIVCPNPGDSASGILPVGTILQFAGATAPSGFLVCDGSDISRATFAQLFSVIGTTYGSGSGTTFRVPDTRGRTVRGLAATGNYTALNDPKGADSGTLTITQLPPHAHGVMRGGATATTSGTAPTDWLGTPNILTTSPAIADPGDLYAANNTSRGAAVVTNTGVGQTAVAWANASITLNHIIKAF